MNRNKILLLVFFLVVFVVGLAIIISNEHVTFDKFARSISDLNSRVLSLIALPIIAVLFFLGVYLRKKSEERKWKQALLRTRAKKQAASAGQNNKDT